MDFSEMIINTGGSTIGPGLTKDALAKTGAKAAVQGYGSTKCCAAGTLDDADNFVHGSAGLVLPHTQIKVSGESTRHHNNCNCWGLIGHLCDSAVESTPDMSIWSLSETLHILAIMTSLLLRSCSHRYYKISL